VIAFSHYKEKSVAQNISLLKALLNVEASPSVPKLSSAQMLDAPENKAIQDIWVLRPDRPELHLGRRIAVLATDGVEEIEVTTVLHYFRSRGAQVDLIAPRLPSYPAYLGIQFPAIRETHIMTITYIAEGGWIKFDRLLEEAKSEDYEVVIIPGGTWNPDTLRAEAKAISFVQEMAAADKIVAAICHGPWVISDAGLTRGKRVTGWWTIRPDLENAGATFIDEPAVTDGKIVTARAPIDLAAFVEAIDNLLANE
jgi:protease I